MSLIVVILSGSSSSMLLKEDKIEIVLIHGENRSNEGTEEICYARHAQEFVSHSIIGEILRLRKSVPLGI